MLPLLLGPPVAGLLTALVLPLAALAGGGAASSGSAAAVVHPSTGPSGPRWRPPLDPPVRILRPFDPPAWRWLPGHRGVDLGAALGRAVRAAGAGTVTWAGPLAGRGVVVVAHDDGLRTTYEPVDALVSEGDRVAAGDLIGTVGPGDVHCGRAPTCLHWGLRRGRDYLDPSLLVDPGRAVLLPP